MNCGYVYTAAFAAALLLGTPVGPVGLVDAAEPPLADAGHDQSVRTGTTVYLDATGSRDPDGRIAAYQWTVESPDGETVTPPCRDCARTTFVAADTGRYAVTVTVSDDAGRTVTDTLYVSVAPDSPPALCLTGPLPTWLGHETRYTAHATVGVNVLDTRHTFSVSTFGDSVTFHTVEQYDPANPGQVPVPEIANVSVFADANETKLRVTFHNPAKQTYPLALFVHTTETDIYTQRPLGRPGETESVVVTLDESVGQRVAGEVRLLAQRASQPRHGLHQVEFVGVAGDRTDHWNQSYEKIRGPWADDPYRYENESVAPQVKPLDVLTAPGMYPVYGGFGFVFVLLYAVWRKLTSPT